jgi:pimeloyl-ACP methyl ester carboxylesterase
MLNLSRKQDLRSHYATGCWTQPYHWYETGKGPPLVMLHGYMAHAMAYRRVFPLIEGYRMVVPDLPGHGRDRTFEDPSLPPTVNGLGDWLSDFLSRFDEPVHLVAHSMGGLAALNVDEELLASLTLVAPGLRIPAPAWTSKLVKMIPASWARISGSDFAMAVYEPFQWRGVAMTRDERSSYLRPLRQPKRLEFMMALGADLLTVPDRMHDLKVPHCPSLVIWGEHDRLMPLQDALLIKRHLTGCTLAIVPNAGHAVMEDSPEHFSEVLVDFIEGSPNLPA